jgi:hypothetical protein
MVGAVLVDEKFHPRAALGSDLKLRRAVKCTLYSSRDFLKPVFQYVL